MSSWVIDMVQAGGYLGIVLLMTIENVFPPIPSELIMPLAGYLAASGDMTLYGVIAAGTGGSVAGALVLYYAGARIGNERLERFVERHGRWLTISPTDLQSAQGWFDRHGALAVFLCRLIPGIRSLISIPAGMSGMRPIVFLAVSIAGTAAWSALLATLGYFLEENFSSVERYIGWVTWAVVAAIVLWYVLRVRRISPLRRHS